MSDLQQVESLIDKREIKKADVIIARLMRSNLPPNDAAVLLIFRARTRLLTGRPDDAINDLAEAKGSTSEFASLSAQFLEIWGDAHFARFELASVGFADRADTLRAQESYQKIHTCIQTTQTWDGCIISKAEFISLRTTLNALKNVSILHSSMRVTSGI